MRLRTAVPQDAADDAGIRYIAFRKVTLDPVGSDVETTHDSGHPVRI